MRCRNRNSGWDFQVIGHIFGIWDSNDCDTEVAWWNITFIKSHWNIFIKSHMSMVWCLVIVVVFGWHHVCFILFSPINSRMYKKGFHELPELQPTGGSTPTAEVIGTNTHWLSWIQPTIFQTGHKQYEQINYTLSFVEKYTCSVY